MAPSTKTGKWYLVPTMVLLIGILSIGMLLGARRMYERQLLNAALVDATREIKIDTLIFHIMEEEVIGGETARHVYGGMAEIDEAIVLADFISKGSGTGPGSIPGNLENLELKTRVEEIKSLLADFKKQGLENVRNPAMAKIGTVTDQQFDAASNVIFKKATALELLFEKNRVRDLTASQSLFWGVFMAWTFGVVAATAGLWQVEKRRKRAEDALLKANEQLFFQAEELTAHREHLTELVEKRTGELTAVNKNLRLEIAERLQTEATLKESEKQIRSLSFQLLRVQEIERRRISMELHDELGQALNVMKLRIGVIEKKSQKNLPALKEDCEQLLAYIDDMIDEVRRLALALSPTILEDLGLTSAVQWLIGNFERIPNIKVRTAIEEIDQLFHQNYRITIYRVIQEALTNIGRYAQAENVSVMIRGFDDKAVFSIEDDGNGFDPEEAAGDTSEKRFGLKTMKERVRMMGGVFDLQSRQGEGTKISFTIPIEKPD